MAAEESDIVPATNAKASKGEVMRSLLYYYNWVTQACLWWELCDFFGGLDLRIAPTSSPRGKALENLAHFGKAYGQFVAWLWAASALSALSIQAMLLAVSSSVDKTAITKGKLPTGDSPLHEPEGVLLKIYSGLLQPLKPLMFKGDREYRLLKNRILPFQHTL